MGSLVCLVTQIKAGPIESLIYTNSFFLNILSYESHLTLNPILLPPAAELASLNATVVLVLLAASEPRADISRKAYRVSSLSRHTKKGWAY